MKFHKLLKSKKIVYLVFVVSFFLAVSFVWAETSSMVLNVFYKGGQFDGQYPTAPEANSKIGLAGVITNANGLCTDIYQLYGVFIQNLAGRTSELKYWSSQPATIIDNGALIEHEFNSGPSGQKNIYKAAFYCFTKGSNVPKDDPATAIRFAQTSRLFYAESTEYNAVTVGGVCDFSSAEWDKTNASVGDTVTLKVKGDTSGCKGVNFGFEIWRGGKDLFSRVETTINSSFPTTGNPPLETTADWQIPSGQKYAFKIRLPGGVDNCARTAGNLCLWSSDLVVGSGGTTEEKTTSIEFKNPLAAEDFRELVDALLVWIFWLAIPIAVIMIVYSGIVIMISRGDPEKFKHSRKILLWAVVGLAVIFIGKGFVALVESILNLGK